MYSDSYREPSENRIVRKFSTEIPLATEFSVRNENESSTGFDFVGNFKSSALLLFSNSEQQR